MKEIRTKTIDGAKYEVTQLKATKGLRLATEVAKIVAPAAGQLSGGSALMDLEVNSDLIAKAISILSSNLDSDKVLEIVSQLSEVTRVDPEGGERLQPLPGIFELHFRGKLKQLIKWLAFALEVQLGDFFESPDAGAEG